MVVTFTIVSLLESELLRPLIVNVFPEILKESSLIAAIDPPLYPIPYLSWSKVAPI